MIFNLLFKKVNIPYILDSLHAKQNVSSIFLFYNFHNYGLKSTSIRNLFRIQASCRKNITL